MEKRKFKIGDKVKVINDKVFNMGVTNGAVGTIKETNILGDFGMIIEFDINGGKTRQFLINAFADKCIRLVKDDKLIFSGNTTILIKDGEKHTAKCSEGDTFDREKGLLICLAKAHGYKFADLQKMLDGAEEKQPKAQEETQPKAQYEMPRKFNVGDVVKVIDNGREYPTYKEWFNEAPDRKEFKKRYKGTKRELRDGDFVKVVAFGKHADLQRMLYAVEDGNGDVFLIGEAGLEIAGYKYIEEKRPAKVGEYIKIVNAQFADGCYKNGDIFEVVEYKEVTGGVYVKTERTHPYCNCRGRRGQSYVCDCEYVVLPNYKPYKITLTEFFKSKEKLFIRCEDRTQQQILFAVLDHLGKKWVSDKTYLEWEPYISPAAPRYISNKGTFVENRDNVRFLEARYYDFEEVDLHN